MHKDFIIEEIWKNREKILKESDYDLDVILNKQKNKTEEYKKMGWIFVSKVEVDSSH